MMNESDRVKSKAMIDSSDSDSEMSDSEFQNVAKKPKLDLAAVSSVEFLFNWFLITKFPVEVWVLSVTEKILLLQQLLWFRR